MHSEHQDDVQQQQQQQQQQPPPPLVAQPWRGRPADVAAAHGTDPARGLTEHAVAARRAAHGPNVVPTRPPPPLWRLVAAQFEDRLVLVLLAAAAVSLALALVERADARAQALVEPLVIALILAANACVGVMQERNAESAIAALKELEPDTAAVLRCNGGRSREELDQGVYNNNNNNNKKNTTNSNGGGDAAVIMDAEDIVSIRTVPAVDLVPGDIVEIAAGAKVPADMRVLHLDTAVLYVDQSIITGESLSVAKTPDPVDHENPVIQDKSCMLFASTTVTRGKCRAIVSSTGPHTEIGRIHQNIANTDAHGNNTNGNDDGHDDNATPLKMKLDEFGDFLSKVILVICILVWLVNIRNFSAHGGMLNGAVYYFKIAVALAVAAIPEGLPAVVTTSLALGAKSMARKNAIIRHLPSVETLGCTTVICSDKTGTITTNQMTVQRVLVTESRSQSSSHTGLAVNGGASGPSTRAASKSDLCRLHVSELEVTGQNMSPVAVFTSSASGSIGSTNTPLEDPARTNCVLAEAASIATLCNDASIAYNQGKHQYECVGEGTEVALVLFAEQLGVPDARVCAARKTSSFAERASICRKYWQSKLSKLATLEFARDRKTMSVLVEGDGIDGNLASTRRLLVKGAPESVIERCTHVRTSDGSREVLTSAARDQLNDVVLRWSSGSSALRCLALATRDNAPAVDQMDLADTSLFPDYESELTFVSLVGMVDPPRPEVKPAIEQCHTAGIRVIMITGDNKATAEAICRRVGIFGESEDLNGKSFTGQEFDTLSSEQQIVAVNTASLFARVEPMHKQRLVDLLRKQREVVAMSGDGVNDAPALKKADIGIAMGSGTAVAKEVSSMVLADDNFATIVAAVGEGRSIYSNMKQFIRYLISSNIGEVWCIFLTALLGMPEALIPVQLLWVNLVTDGLPATALSFNKPDAKIMEQKPRGLDDSIISGWLFFRYMAIGTYVGVATVGGFAWWYLFHDAGPKMLWRDLVSFNKCVEDSSRSWSCDVFDTRNASTVALTILVLIEMLNALNSLSENQSLLVTGPFSNLFLVAAIALSLVLHMGILYVPVLANVFAVTPLTWGEWIGVLGFSAPVLLIDEALKFIARIGWPKDLPISASKKSE